MRVWALLAALAALAATCRALPSANIADAAASKQQALDRVLQHAVRVQQQRRPANASSNGAVGAAPGAGRAAKLGEELSWVRWLRYTHPRVMSSEPQHKDEAVTRGVVTQHLSHEDDANDATWQQTYFRCSSSYEEGGPAFVMLSGTSDYLPAGGDWLREGWMATLARKHKADRFFLPTRFFGTGSQPTADTAADSLKYLTVEEVILDVGSFLDQLKEAGVLGPQQKVVLFGAGFGGAVATYARQRFPDVVHGVLASSATVEARYSVSSYFPVVTKAVDWYHRNEGLYGCASPLRDAFQALEHQLDLPEGRAMFNQYFTPCTPLPETSDGVVSTEDRAHILGLTASVFADVVQEDEDGPKDERFASPGGDKLWPYCQVLAESRDEPLKTLGMLVSTTYQGLCLETSFAKLVESLQSPAWNEPANSWGLRPWLWLQCSELGQLPTTTGSTDTFPYSTRLNSAFYATLCNNVFSDSVTSNLVDNISKLNKNYGGLKPDITNAIYINGDLDPWKALSPSAATGSGMHVYTVLRASHAHDLFPRDDYDPPWMKKTRKDAERVLASWLA